MLLPLPYYFHNVITARLVDKKKVIICNLCLLGSQGLFILLFVSHNVNGEFY